MAELPNDKYIVLFDGFCNLCNNSIKRIIKHDKKDNFRFAPLQSEIGEQLTAKKKIDRNQTDSIVLVEPNGATFVKSSAALRIAKNLSFYSWMRIFLPLPTKFRDWIYNIIAKNRYRWFGKKNECMIPTPELKAKFLSA